MAERETSSIISADKVEGTAVYDRSGNRLGTVEDVMLDKVSGKALYAIMSFGGFLGMGENHYPLPWSSLTYDTGQGGYVVDLKKEQLQNAPTYDPSNAGAWTSEYGRDIDQYWNRSRTMP
ncbi:MAG: PRC-barrel domain-containing protein [Gemmatimonas sp.]